MLVLRTSAMTALLALDALSATGPVPPASSMPPAKAADAPSVVKVPLSGTALSIELVAVPVGPDGRVLWIGRTEIPWEALDVFVHGLDEGASTPEADAVTRPSKPYISMDRGFGHHGYPAISVSHRNASEFCRWLSAKSKGRFRLPTRTEWTAACAKGAIPADGRLDFAWLAENAERKTHPVASRRADASGLHDMLGNACEWATDGSSFVVMGGCYRDPAPSIECGHAVPASDEWNASDPQLPRGEWWLADAGFVGFRVVCEELPKEIRP